MHEDAQTLGLRGLWRAVFTGVVAIKKPVQKTGF
jgi:hypothetical protein